MNINIYKIYINTQDSVLLKKIYKQLKKQNLKIDTIMAEQTQLAAELREVTAQVTKIATEVTTTLQKVEVLEAALQAADDVTPEVQEAFDALKAQVIALDEQIPDAPTTPEEPA